MRIRGVIFCILFTVLCSFVVSATTVSLYPDSVPSATNREYNLSLNNLNFKDSIVNITIDSDDFTITQAFGGEQWAVTNTDHHAHWDNNTLGTDVVYALFPFRATSPSVEQKDLFNITVTLYGEHTVQRLHREIAVHPPMSKQDVFSVSNSIVKRGVDQQLTLSLLTPGSSEVSGQFLNSDLSIASRGDDYVFTIHPPATQALGVHALSLTGLFEGALFEQAINLSIIPHTTISLTAPTTINTSSGFTLTGSVLVDDGRQLNGSKITIFWADGEHPKLLATANNFSIDLTSGTEKGDFVILVQYELDDVVYSQKHTVHVDAPESSSANASDGASADPQSDSSSENSTQSTTQQSEQTENVASPSNPNKEKIKDITRGRTGVIDIDPSRKPSKGVNLRGFALVLFILVGALLVYMAFKNINVDLFSKTQEKEVKKKEREHSDSLSWDDYFDKRRRD